MDDSTTIILVNGLNDVIKSFQKLTLLEGQSVYSVLISINKNTGPAQQQQHMIVAVIEMIAMMAMKIMMSIGKPMSTL